ncbi:MAG: restriction endonuclease [Methanimicrococcus sp.]|nr:restriction endonuclease [Methanimicrococcus sp.]
MANFSKYLGKEERVLNFIDMKDETVWSQNNIAAAEFKSWTSLVITNKRLFSLNKRKLYMKEFRLEDIVSTGWIYRPQWGKIIWGAIFLILAALACVSAVTLVSYLADLAYGMGADAALDLSSWLTWGFLGLAVVFALAAVVNLISYFLLKRTTMTISTKDGKEYKFLLRGRRHDIDEFRLALQEAKDLYLEETENRYFDKMRTVLFDQSNYEYALNSVRPAGTPIGDAQAPKLDGGGYMFIERKNAYIGGSNNNQIGEGGAELLPEATMRLNSDGTLQLEAGGAYQLTADDKYLLKEGGSPSPEDGDKPLTSSDHLSQAPLFLKAADLFKQMGFDVSALNAGDADLLLYKDNLRYIVVVDEDQNGAVTQSKIEKAVQVKNQYKTDFGLFISGGDMAPEVQDYANKNNVKVIYIQRTESDA